MKFACSSYITKCGVGWVCRCSHPTLVGMRTSFHPMRRATTAASVRISGTPGLYLRRVVRYSGRSDLCAHASS